MHLWITLFDAQKQVQLVVCPNEIVVGILALPILVAAQIVPKEADTLHIGEESRGVGQVLYLDGQEETLGTLEITFGEGLEDIHAELDLVHFGTVLGNLVGCGAKEIAIIGEDEVGHNCVEVDDAKHVVLLVEHHVVDFRVAMADAFRKSSFPSHSLGLAHLVGSLLNLGKHVLHALFLHPTSRVALDDVVQLFETELHVVEVLDGLAQLNGNVGKHSLEVAESLACSPTALGIDGLFRDGVVDEDHQAPISAVDYGVELLRIVFRGDETQDSAVDIGSALLQKFLADMGSDGVDVAHHHIDIGKDNVVDALQHVIGFVLLGSFHFVSVVDKAFA